MHFPPAQKEPARQIEVAVEKISIPGNGNERPTHEPGDSAWVKVFNEPFQVAFKIA
jgi:hypothetical protein